MMVNVIACVMLNITFILNLSAIQEYEFVDLGTLSTSCSEAISINDKGQVLGCYEESGKRIHFIWSESEGIKELSLPDTVSSARFIKINNNGDLIGSFRYKPHGFRSFIMDCEGNFTFFERVVDKKDGQTHYPETYYPLDLNNNGQVVGYITVNSPCDKHNIPFLWDDKKIILLSTKKISESPMRFQVRGEAFSINDHGVIVGKLQYRLAESHSHLHAVTWGSSYFGYTNYIDLHPYLPQYTDQSSAALCINNNDKIVGHVMGIDALWCESGNGETTPTYKYDRIRYGNGNTIRKINDNDDLMFENYVCYRNQSFIENNCSHKALSLKKINESIIHDIGFEKVEKLIDFNNNREVIARIKMPDGRNHGILIKILK